MTELMIPPAAKQDPAAFEILRVWAANGDQHVTIHSELNGQPYDFGYMLADLALHGAKLYSERFTIPLGRALDQIIDGFKDEISNQDGDVSGEILK